MIREVASNPNIGKICWLKILKTNLDKGICESETIKQAT